jgi:hypothetical protein
MAIPKKIIDVEKPTVTHELRKTLRRNWGARVSSACFARLAARYGRGRAVLTALRLDNDRHHRG